uniref:Uncharacterized protein n=1 Tax=Tanacetum cinerariifolium TaxID=118510 RepID=A0A699K0W8_TANCI|nr:hypothetical protein [Tanacetum cinerariifolium]
MSLITNPESLEPGRFISSSDCFSSYTESPNNSMQSFKAEISQRDMPCTSANFTIDEAVVRVVSRATDKAVWANSLGLVWISPALVDSELMQSSG